MLRAGFKSILMILSIIMFAGCSNGIEHEKQNIVVQKQVGNHYEDFKKIKDSEQVEKVKEILADAHWKDVQVAFVRPADYQFFFEFKNPEIEAKPVLHNVWISPKKDGVEVTRWNQEYTQLTKNESARLIEILTGERLGD